MNIRDCVYDSIKKLSDDVKADILEKIDSFSSDGEILKYMRELQAESKIELTNTKLHLMMVDDLSTDMKSYMATRVKGPKQKDPYKFIEDLLSGGASRQDFGKTGRIALDRHIESIIGENHAYLAEMMETFKPSVLSDSMTKQGIKDAALGTSSNKALFDDVIRAIYGDSNVTGAASKFAKGWREVTENLRVRYNKAGGNIKKLDDFNMPTYHDSTKLIKLGREKWITAIKKHGDIDRILKNAEAKRLDLERAGRAKIKGKAKKAAYKVPRKTTDEILSEMFDTVSQEGMNKFEPKGFKGTGSFSAKHSSQRQIFFKSGDDYLSYHQDFGTDDYFNASMSYIDRMSTEIGAMEILGPNPDLAIYDLMQLAKKETGSDAPANILNAYDEVMHRLIGTPNMTGNSFGLMRNSQTGSKLGLAVLSSISDTTATAHTAAYNGIPVLKALSGFMRRLQPSVYKSDRIAVTQMGLMAEYAISNASNLFRYGEITGWGKGFAQSMLRLSGLNHWTNVAKVSFNMEFLANLANKTKSKYSELPSAVRNSLERYGINKADWENIRKTEFFKKDGVNFVNPQAFSAKGEQDLAAKLVGMVREETAYAVPEANAKIRAMMNQGTSRNTLLGESVRTAFQFKNYGVTVLASHMARGLYQEGAAAPMKYLGSFIAGSTIMGYAALSAKDIVKGLTPRDMSKPATWRDSLLQGGSLGVVADLVANAGFGGGLAQALVGPFLSDVGNFGVFMYGKRDDVNLLEAKMYKQMAAQIGSKAAKMTVGQLWFTRLAVEKSLIEHLDRIADDNYNKKQRSKRRRLAKEYGQSFIGE